MRVHISRTRALALLRRALPDLLVILGALVLEVILTFPVSLHPGDYLLGGHGDSTATVFTFWWSLHAHSLGIPYFHDPFVGIPFGMDVGAIPKEPLYNAAETALTWVFGDIAAFNLLILLPVPLAAWGMFRLALRLSRSRIAGAFAALAYAFSPFFIGQILGGEATLAHAESFPWAALALLRLLDRPRPGRMLLAALAFAAGALFNFYYALFLAIMATVIVWIWGAVRLGSLPVRSIMRAYLAAILTGVMALGLVGLVVYAAFGSQVTRASDFGHPPVNLLVVAPRLDEVTLPPRLSPLMGALGQRALDTAPRPLGYPAHDEPLYVSEVVLVFAAAALLLVLTLLVRTAFTRLTGGVGLLSLVARPPAPLTAPAAAEPLALVAVALVGLWLLVPPEATWNGIALPSLQAAIFALAPTYRVFSRAIMLAHLGLAPVAAMGLAALGRRIPRPEFGVVTILMAAVLMSTYYIQPQDTVLSVSRPEAYQWLDTHPGNYAIAEFPMVPSNSGGYEYGPVFNQRYHDHPIVNTMIPKTPSDSLDSELQYADQARTAGILAALGVRYVFYHRDIANGLVAYEPAAGRDRRHWTPVPQYYRLEATFGDTSIYELIEPPANQWAFYRSGFDPAEYGPDGNFGRWLTGTTGSIALMSAKEQVLDVQFSCISYNQPRTLHVGSPGSDTYVYVRQSAEVHIDLHVPVKVGETDLALDVTPGAEPSAPADLGYRPLAVNCTRIDVSPFTPPPAKRGH
ncbi:MAG: hypothetical protein ACYDAY_01115 [Candidatus Dormibacteria bacterium]